MTAAEQSVLVCPACGCNTFHAEKYPDRCRRLFCADCEKGFTLRELAVQDGLRDPQRNGVG
jgi:transposase-like protein